VFIRFWRFEQSLASACNYWYYMSYRLRAVPVTAWRDVEFWPEIRAVMGVDVADTIRPCLASSTRRMASNSPWSSTITIGSIEILVSPEGKP